MTTTLQESAGDFIEVYDGALSAGDCAHLIRRFEASGKATRGATGGGVNITIKNSWDIAISDRPEWADAERAFNSAMYSGLKRYLRTYPYTLLAPLALKMAQPGGGEPLPIDPQVLAALDDDRFGALVAKTLRPGKINIQKYLADEGGYPRWHCELYPKLKDPHADTLHRVLLWTIYLNEEFGEGETEFLHQQRRITPRTGSLLIAPTAFTHTHRGNMPKGGNKYIATSWVLFQPAEKVYGA
jgi:2OG-Fe(II) oxygenase superfamily